MMAPPVRFKRKKHENFAVYVEKPGGDVKKTLRACRAAAASKRMRRGS
jgi:hypothetical protein